jgi:hypothetical protein
MAQPFHVIILRLLYINTHLIVSYVLTLLTSLFSPVPYILLLLLYLCSAGALLSLTGMLAFEGGSYGSDFLPIGQHVISFIRIVLLGRSTLAGNTRPNESTIYPTH